MSLSVPADFDIYGVNGYDKSIGEEKTARFMGGTGRNRRFSGYFVPNRSVDGQLRD